MVRISSGIRKNSDPLRTSLACVEPFGVPTSEFLRIPLRERWCVFVAEFARIPILCARGSQLVVSRSLCRRRNSCEFRYKSDGEYSPRVIAGDLPYNLFGQVELLFE
jgi:hypothetical protein